MEWQPIETAPKDGTTVDLWHRKHGRVVDAWWDSYGWDDEEKWIAYVGGEKPDFTHWMQILPPDSILREGEFVISKEEDEI